MKSILDTIARHAASPSTTKTLTRFVKGRYVITDSAKLSFSSLMALAGKQSWCRSSPNNCEREREERE